MTYHHRLAAPRIIAPGGPVSAALRTMLANVEACDRQRLRDLRQRIADRIEADLALLDAISGDCDFEDGADAEPSLCGMTVAWPHAGGDDRECDEAERNGIGDHDGLIEQGYGITARYA